MVKVKAHEEQREIIHHLVISLLSFACSVGDNSEVHFHLYDSSEGKMLSERAVMFFNASGIRASTDKNNNVLFTDLSSEDLKKEIYLVVQIFRKGRLTPEGSFKKVATFQYRRPWGVSVLNLRDMFQIKPENELEYFLRVQMVDSDGFYNMHENLIKRQTQLIGKNTVADKQNLQGLTLSVKILDGDIRTVKECILGANGEPMSTNFLSYVLYHNNSPKWNETIRLSIPNEKFNTSHIRLEISHCSNRDRAEKKLYGFAFLSVTLNNTVVTRFDGKYDLCIYRVEDNAKIKNYLSFPSERDDFNDPKKMPHIPENLPFQHSNKEFITVETFLVSSKFTQKAELINIFQWSSTPERVIPQNLENLCNLRGQELVRYMNSLLEALFGMLNSKNGERVPYTMNIFHALVHLFYLVQQEVFEKFSVVLEDYLENIFSSPVAYRELLYCLQKQGEKIYTCTDFEEKASKNMFKVLVDIFKFAVRSCILALRWLILNIPNDHNQALRPPLVDAPSTCTSVSGLHVEIMIHQLLRRCQHLKTTTYQTSILARFFAIDMQNLSPLCTPYQSLSLVDPQVKDARGMLLPMVIGHLKRNMYYKRHLALTANTLGDLLSCIFTVKQTADVTEEVAKIIQGLFDRVVRTLLVIDDDQRAEAGSLLVSSLTEMLRLMDESHYKKLMNVYPKPKPLRRRLSLAAGLQSAAACKDFLLRVVLVFQDLINKNDFPPDWTTMRMITNNVMLTAIQYIADDLTGNFNGDDFDKEVRTGMLGVPLV
ncbi:dedicator of cytokinesis protein 3 [Elysia marginata]|uniref:Dedicator of cytokinesis protein 3 n=1 Tax=Elysia marginata TaxID=1093978 RepID=A0AAV4IHX6_9GAST|nr:dedicator of cytokinesis protein 3 [Elysia marginata]